MPPLRLALVTEAYTPQINGVARTLERLVGHLSARGDRVLLLVPAHPGAPSPGNGVEKREFKGFSLPLYKEVVLCFVPPGRLARELSRFAPDLVHIATEGPLGWGALRAARHLQVPTVSSYHTNFPDYLRLYGLGFLEGLAWRGMRAFHNATLRTFCPTPSVGRLLEEKGIRNHRIWPRGVDGERFHPGRRSEELRRHWGAGENDTVLMYVGRLAAEKNLEMLLDAWALLPHKGKKLVLVGDGPLRGKLEERRLEGVVFAGYRTGEALAAAYASADLFVFPSLTETFGNVLLEGMASGLPAVGFRAPGPQDIITDGYTGVLVDTVAASALARAMGRLASDRALLRPMGANARAYAEKQSWGEILGALREEYVAAFPHTSHAQITAAEPACNIGGVKDKARRKRSRPPA